MLIRSVARDNPVSGEERIASEMLAKLGIRVSPRTVVKYMPKRPDGQPRGDARWSTFLKNHAKAILSFAFFAAVTATFRLLSEPTPRKTFKLNYTAIDVTRAYGVANFKEV